MLFFHLSCTITFCCKTSFGIILFLLFHKIPSVFTPRLSSISFSLLPPPPLPPPLFFFFFSAFHYQSLLTFIIFVRSRWRISFNFAFYYYISKFNLFYISYLILLLALMGIGSFDFHFWHFLMVTSWLWICCLEAWLYNILETLGNTDWHIFKKVHRWHKVRNAGEMK